MSNSKDNQPKEGSGKKNQPKKNQNQPARGQNQRSKNNYPKRDGNPAAGSSSSRGNSGQNPRNHGNRREAPVHNHKVDMSKYEKMIGAAQANFSDIQSGEGKTEECTICWKSCDLFGLGSCRHPICIECAIRIRVLKDQKSCHVCRGEMELMYFTFASSGLETIPLNFPLSGHPDESRYGVRFENEAAGTRYEKYLAHVCKICKTAEGDRLEFPSFISLRQHMASKHQLSYCHICTDNLDLFSRERKTFTRDALQRHIKHGDSDDKSQKGHPSCLFCDLRFFDLEAQYRHLRKEHFFCQFCEADGARTNVFFGKHEELLQHYKASHYLCEVEECRSMGIAFANVFDFQMHTSREHSSSKKMALDFKFSDRQLMGAGGRTGPAGRPRREAADALPPRRAARIAVVPQEVVAPPPPPDDREVVIVASAESRPGNRFGSGRSFLPNTQDFPSLGGGASRSNAPQVVVPNEFPRLSKTGRPSSAQLDRSKKQKAGQPPAVDDFPSLGGPSTGPPSNGTAARQQEEWAKHSARFEMIDEDERMGSHSGSGREPPGRPSFAAKIATSSTHGNGTAATLNGEKTPMPGSSRGKVSSCLPGEEFPSLPSPAPSNRQPPPMRWAAKAAGAKGSAIVGVKMPSKKKALPVPDVWPERSVTTPARDPVEEQWKEIPVTKKPTKKERREMQRRLQAAAAEHSAERRTETEEEGMMRPPEEDLEMQAILMEDILSVSGRGTDSTVPEKGRNEAESRSKGNDSSSQSAATSKAAGNKENAPATQKGKKNEKKEGEANNNKAKAGTQPSAKETTKQKKAKKDMKDDFPVLAKPSSVPEIRPEPETPSTGLASWFNLSSVTSVFSGLSLSNVLGDNSGPLSEKSLDSANQKKEGEKSVPCPSLPDNSAPPGLSTAANPPRFPASPPSSVPAVPSGMVSGPPPGLTYSAPPGFENVQPAAPPGLSGKQTPAPQLFSMAPFISTADTQNGRSQISTTSKPTVDEDGWTVGKRK